MYRRILLPLIAAGAVLALFWSVMPTDANAERRLAGDTYIYDETRTLSQPIAGNLQVYGSDIVVANTISGDLFVVAGTVSFTAAGRVNGDLIYAGSKISNAEDRVSGGVYPLFSIEGAVASITKSAVVASLLLAWLVVAVVVTLMSGREVRASSVEVRSSSLHCFVVGLVAVTSFVLTAIAFSYLIPYMVGIPLLAALAVFVLLTKVYGMIAMFHAVGTLVAGARSRQQLSSRRWLRGDLAMVVIGLLLLGAIRFLPVVGTVVWGLTSVFGVGVALATRFGRRDPWFLEFRAVEA